jgi:EAL domain-containing protein (putative c-di-GMP-specific phosphodiesterase class I)
MEAALSRLFRYEGVRQGHELPGQANLFLNTHPTELSDEGLIESLIELREAAPTVSLTLEIHEAAITDLEKMTKLRASLKRLDIQLAYDDFGAGQARLVDLIEVPPDYLKFDIALVRDIHHGSTQRVQMLETLVRMAHDLGVAVLAEGIECEGEGDACAQLGFDLAQGYHFGKPVPTAELSAGMPCAPPVAG